MQNENARKIMIDYYCFPNQLGSIPIFDDLEKYHCRKKGQLANHADMQKDANKAREKGKLILFDVKSNTFINDKGEEIDISGKIIFPRSDIEHGDILMEYIEKASGISICTKEDYKEILYWFEKIKVQREYISTTRKEVEENLDYYLSKFGKSFFIKTVRKSFSGVFTLDEDTVFGTTFRELVILDDLTLSRAIPIPGTPILVCKQVEILEDDYGDREWRAFVVNNELFSLSRCSDEDVIVEEYVYEKVKEKIEEFKGKIPESYVVDFFEYKEGETIIFDVIEFNPIICSGIFANNELVK